MTTEGQKPEGALSQAFRLRKHLTGRVAKILNARELVINIGSKQGVKDGQKFAVLGPEPIEIRDPTTNEVLDTIDREKVRVQAVEVRDRVAVCRTYRIQGGFPGQGFARAFLAAQEPIAETLRVQDQDLPPLGSEQDSFVKIGDRVVPVEQGS